MYIGSISNDSRVQLWKNKITNQYILVVITDYKVRSMLHGVLEEVVIVKRKMEENIEQGKMK